MPAFRRASPIGVAVLAAATIALVKTGPAAASQLVDRGAREVRLQVDATGVALLTYRVGDRRRKVLAWGAVNARTPSESGRQVRFRLDYSGGWGAFKRNLAASFDNACRPAVVPLRYAVAACRAADGSYWAVQAWPRGLPNYGIRADASQRAAELRLSHWRGPLPRLTVRFGWTYRRFLQLYGTLTYRGRPVHGFSSTADGQPLDPFGRNVYLDVLDSPYGRGWRRENAFLTHVGTGGFCYGVYPHGRLPAGRGVRYRATVIGPGVTPDVVWEDAAPQRYSHGHDRRADRQLARLLRGDRLCRAR